MAQGKDDRLKDYVTVAERVGQFHESYPAGRINTQIVQHDLETGFVLMRAEVYRSPDDASPSATGHAFEVRGDSYVNKTSYVENAETSAVGRALALLGFKIKGGIASAEEMQKAHAAPSPRLNGDIRVAQEILGKTDESLTEAVMRKFGGTEAWAERPEAQREWLFGFLSKKVNEKAAEVRN